MAVIKSNVLGLSNKSVTVEVERTATKLVVDIESETIIVLYRTESYYMDGETRKVISVENGSYPGDFAEWQASGAGQAIQTAIETKLASDDPKTV